MNHIQASIIVKISEIRFVRIPFKACFIIFVVGYLTINLLQNFPLSKSERERHLPIETPPGQKIYQDDQLKKSKLTTENKLEDGIPDIPISSKSTSIGILISLSTMARDRLERKPRNREENRERRTKKRNRAIGN